MVVILNWIKFFFFSKKLNFPTWDLWKSVWWWTGCWYLHCSSQDDPVEMSVAVRLAVEHCVLWGLGCNVLLQRTGEISSQILTDPLEQRGKAVGLAMRPWLQSAGAASTGALSLSLIVLARHPRSHSIQISSQNQINPPRTSNMFTQTLRATSGLVRRSFPPRYTWCCQSFTVRLTVTWPDPLQWIVSLMWSYFTFQGVESQSKQ